MTRWRSFGQAMGVLAVPAAVLVLQIVSLPGGLLLKVPIGLALGVLMVTGFARAFRVAGARRKAEIPPLGPWT